MFEMTSRGRLRESLRLWVIVGLVPTAVAMAADRGLDRIGSQSEEPAAWAAFRAAHPGADLFALEGRVTRVYGRAFSSGESPEQSAAAFLGQHSDVFGVESVDLAPGGMIGDDEFIVPVMYVPEEGGFRFTLVSYRQVTDGIPVFRADVRLLARNEEGYPLVLVSSGLRDLGGFHVSSSPISELNTEMAFAAAQKAHPELIQVLSSELVIWAGVNDMTVSPALAIQVMADNGLANQPDYSKWLVLADANTGAILYEEDQIRHTDIVGNVSGMATPLGVGADICGTETSVPLPYARVLVQGGSTAFADAAGNFTIPNGGNTQVTVESGVRGRWFRVRYETGAEATVLTQQVTPPGPANFTHNLANNNELIRAEVNGYVQANVVRDFTLVQNPSYPTIGTQQEFRVNVNLSSTCNAFYDGSSINFYRSGGGCANTAFDTVVHHEYGHHLVQVGGSGQDEYGEGMGDVMGVLITDNSVLAYGFQNNCNNGIRNANNTLQYPCSGEIHYCGQLISGCVWSTRDELIQTNPDTYLEILSRLAVNAILMHTGGGIAPDITIDYLTLDDTDGDIGNGTPHYSEIAAGFGEHNMDAPPLALLDFSYPNGLPTTLTPDTPTSFQVRILDLAGTLDESSPRLNYRVDGGGFTAVGLANQGDRLFNATIPGIACGSVVDFFLSATTTSGGSDRDPDASNYTAGSGQSDVFTDNFQTDKGWTVVNENLADGAWERGVPVGGGSRGDPASDFDGSGSCYLTANRSGNSDVDGGPTRLISPTFDLSASGAYTIGYARWFSNDDGDGDRLVVEVSNNNGTNWVQVESVGNTGGWVYRTFNVLDYVAPSAQVKVRFSATDNPNDSVTEAAIDAVRISRFNCGGGGNEVTCDDIAKFKARCKANGLVKGTLVLLDDSRNGATVTISIDGTPFDVTVNGNKAIVKDCCRTGPQTVELTTPSGCPGTSKTADCP
ncbi:MAG: choice-of-anchor J domain-containing protein [Phycisphaerales bacterium]|nr:choice-of-anchor J domain-containing protein [Phycisphaerales bacterium]